MSNRLKILFALLKNGAQTYDDLELATQIDRSQLRIAVNDAKKAGHLSMGRDDVTHLPAYKITAEGTNWLKSNAAKKQPAQTQPAVVENTGSRESVPPVGQSRPPAEVAAADRDAGASHDAPAVQPDYKFVLHLIRKALGIDHDDGIGIVPTIEALIESNSEWRQRADKLEELLEAGVTADRAAPVDLTEVAIGYLVRVPKRQPRLFLKPERAAKAAQAAAKAAGRADVLALVHAGTARRKKAVTVEYTPTHQDSRHD